MKIDFSTHPWRGTPIASSNTTNQVTMKFANSQDGSRQSKKNGRVIGLGGLKEHGKDAVADYLVEEHDFVKLGMSDLLAKALYVLDPWVFARDNTLDEPHQNYVRYSRLVDSIGYVEAKKYPEVRRLLQNLGTEVGRNLLGQNTWIGPVGDIVQEITKDAGSVVVTGVRFPDELSGIDEAADVYHAWREFWWVDRPGYTSNAATQAHASENSLDEGDFDLTVSNDGTLQDLYDKVEGLLNA